ncbi:hypothetical protein HZA76_03025 [Candidatus Roizmanbacteria bacterium]|nr:hypothetical protein [Candidatus Roizmanbacteria bacterium]
MNKKLVFIKLGGSLISDKTKVNQANLKVIDNLSKEIKAVLDQDNNLSLFLFTGAGGFGHPVAEKYKNNLKEGLTEIKNACKKLNQIVVDTLINQSGLKTVSIEPDKIVEYRNGKLTSLLNNSIFQLLGKNIIPVFHADLVHDKKLGVSVLSMDKFLADSAVFFKDRGFKIEKVIFAGTTSGVVDRHGRTIPRLTKKDFVKMENVFYKGIGIDVSGGMKYKVEQCLKLADRGIESQIVDGRTKNIFNKTGTVISK